MRFKLGTFTLVITFAGTLINSSFVDASETEFFCGSRDGVPTTVARTKESDVPVISWRSQYFANSGFEPQKRCEIVSAKFQEYHDAGTLKYLTTGRENGQNIVCVAQEENGKCVGQLFTLQPDSNPGETLKQLLSVRDRKSPGPINQSSERVYINMGNYLLEANYNTEGEDSMTNSPQVPLTNSETPQENESVEDDGGLW